MVLQKEGYPTGLAYAQAYQALAFACERTKREAGLVLTAPDAPQEGLTLREMECLMNGLAERLGLR